MASDKKLLLNIPLEREVLETDAAYGIWTNDQILWFPKSQVEEFEQEDGYVSFWCPRWLVEAKGCEIFVDTSYEPKLFE